MKDEPFPRAEFDPAQFPSEPLFYWYLQPRNPVLASEDPLVRMFIEAMLTGEETQFVYVGGSTPGLPRTVHVALVFQHTPKGRVYAAGYCHTRKGIRVFRLDLAMVIHVWN